MTFIDEYHAALDGPETDIRDHLQYMHRAACKYPPARVLELGTRDGQSTRAFLAAAEKTGGHVWSIDIDHPQVPVSEWEATGLWTMIVKDDMRASFFSPVDVLFIDTSHLYGHTIAELYRYVPLVVPGGLVLLHDTEWKPPDHPVAQALDLYCAETGRTWRNHPGSFGLGEIEIR